MAPWRRPYDPIQPDLTHAPSDGTPGVVVGDDTGTMPACTDPPRRPWLWWLPLVLLSITIIIITIVVALAFAPDAGGSTLIIPVRPDSVCRCGVRPPI